MFLRVLSFAINKNFDHTWSLGHGQNVVGPTPLSKPDGVSSNCQEMFLRVLSFACDNNDYRSFSLGHDNKRYTIYMNIVH